MIFLPAPRLRVLGRMPACSRLTDYVLMANEEPGVEMGWPDRVRPVVFSSLMFISGGCKLPRPMFAIFLLGLLSAGAVESDWTAGTRVVVEKDGTGHRAIILQGGADRCFVAFEGEEESFDEWVEVVLPRGRIYTFTLAARDDRGHTSPPLRIVVNP